jgi:leucyl/phenylalanyl-tRNA--protein transferase
MIAAYCALHQAGYAHSIETWMRNDDFTESSEQPANSEQLAGGLYGVAIGRVFYGESMFMRKTDASKIALSHLADWLQQHDFGVIDCQMNTPHLASLGAREIPRTQFAELLDQYADRSGLADWRGLSERAG